MPGLQASTTTASTSVTYHGNSSDLWEYAVPLETDLGHHQEDSAPSSYKPRNYPNSPTNGYNSRQHDNKATRSFSNPLDTPGYLEPAKPHSLRHKDSTVSSNHDGDSLFDLYGGKLSTVGAMSTETVNGHNGNLTDEESKWIDSEKLARIEGKQLEQLKQSDYNTRWIDRDKLERIEIQELEQAGILPPKGARGSYNALQGAYQSDDGVVTRGRTNSDSSQDERRYYDPNEPDNDLRHPSERTGERGRPMQNSQRNRSSSRIPLYASSPVPVPQHHLERTAPLKRQPPSPDNGSDDGSTRTHSRKRSYSAGSAVLLTESTPPTTATPAGPKPPATPQTNRVKSNLTSPNRSNSKKGRFSGSSMAKNKHKSNPQLTPSNRPTSSHQVPEGPPPWSLSTYNPDPKLPPDQQIIPTVARRLQQEQWEKEGVFATVYDKQLRPLKVQDAEEAQKEKEEAKQKEEDKVKEQVVLISTGNEWPPNNPPDPASPIVATPPPKEEKDEKSRIETPKPGKEENQFAPRTITKVNDRNVSQAGQPEAIRMNIPDKEEKKKKKFACCIIM